MGDGPFEWADPASAEPPGCAETVGGPAGYWAHWETATRLLEVS